MISVYVVKYFSDKQSRNPKSFSRLKIKKAFFTVRIVSHWNKFPKEVAGAQYLETFKTSPDGAMSNLI